MIIVDNLFNDWKTGKDPPQKGEVILVYDPLFHTLRCAKYDNQIFMAEQRWINLMAFQTSLMDIYRKASVQPLPNYNPI